MKSRSQLMVERLRDLQASSPDIEASAVVSVDGLIIASALPQSVEEDRVSAMSAAMLSLEMLEPNLETVFLHLTGKRLLFNNRKSSRTNSHHGGSFSQERDRRIDFSPIELPGERKSLSCRINSNAICGQGHP